MLGVRLVRSESLGILQVDSMAVLDLLYTSDGVQETLPRLGDFPVLRVVEGTLKVVSIV